VNDGGDSQRVKASDPRLLHRRSELGYTPLLNYALHDEPEAITAVEQERQSRAARLRERQRRLDAFVALRATILPALDTFLDVVGPSNGIGSTARAARRSIERLGQQSRANSASRSRSRSSSGCNTTGR
jgi:hypothetical protein